MLKSKAARQWVYTGDYYVEVTYFCVCTNSVRSFCSETEHLKKNTKNVTQNAVPDPEVLER